jgi:hypothetical protein
MQLVRPVLKEGVLVDVDAVGITTFGGAEPGMGLVRHRNDPVDSDVLGQQAIQTVNETIIEHPVGRTVEMDVVPRGMHPCVGTATADRIHLMLLQCELECPFHLGLHTGSRQLPLPAPVGSALVGELKKVTGLDLHAERGCKSTCPIRRTTGTPYPLYNAGNKNGRIKAAKRRTSPHAPHRITERYPWLAGSTSAGTLCRLRRDLACWGHRWPAPDATNCKAGSRTSRSARSSATSMMPRPGRSSPSTSVFRWAMCGFG